MVKKIKLYVFEVISIIICLKFDSNLDKVSFHILNHQIMTTQRCKQNCLKQVTLNSRVLEVIA